ncbi:hypothetical protein D3C80_1967410 [compost metagenome]
MGIDAGGDGMVAMHALKGFHRPDLACSGIECILAQGKQAGLLFRVYHSKGVQAPGGDERHPPRNRNRNGRDNRPFFVQRT